MANCLASTSRWACTNLLALARGTLSNWSLRVSKETFAPRSLPLASSRQRSATGGRKRPSCSERGATASLTKSISSNTVPGLSARFLINATEVLPSEPDSTRSMPPCTMGCSQVRNCMSSRARA
ncbi:hypothetical protein D9M68_965260 [compost metagenome]